MFHIVEFIVSAETKIVPASWVWDGMSYWPPYSSRERCTRAVMRAETPDNLWSSYDVRIRCTRETYSEARLSQSDVQTDSQEFAPAYQKREGRCNKRLMVWEQEEEELQQQFKRRTLSGDKPLPTPLMISLPSSSSTPSVHTSPPTHNLANDPVIQEILTKLETIEKHQLLILRHLQRCSPEQQPVEVPDVDLPVPVTSQGQLSRVEEAIVLQPDLKRKLIVYFGMIGGMTVKETVWRVLTKMLTNNFAKKVNWRGANGKQAFEPLALKGILLSAVRRNSLTSDATDGEIERYAKRWLQLATDRDGGRRERQKRKEMNVLN